MSKTNKNKEDTEDTNNTDNEFAGAQFTDITEVKSTDITEVESVSNSEEGMPEDKIKSLANKFIALKKDALLEVAKDYPKKKSLLIDYSELFKFNVQLCDELIDFPDKVIRIFEEVVNEQNIPINFVGEVKFHVRFILPKGFTIKIRDVTSEYINKFFCVDGVITRVSDVLPKVYVGVFQCPLCGKRKEVYQEKNRNLIIPSVCDNCKKAVRFKLLPEESKFVDIQRLEIQEPLEMLRGGEEARKIEIWLTDDLTGKVLPGNRIEVVGVMKLIPPKDVNDAVYRKFIDANNVNVVDREFIEVDLSEEDIKKINEFAKSPNIAEKFISSISPTIYGYKEIKEAIALQLFGGSKFELPDKTKTRSEIHLLLIGDPGVAKSKLLVGASNIAPKSIYVSGKGTSAAGLTATAEKDEFAEGAWVLKAGALVLASGGIACLHPDDNIIINNEIRSIGELFNDAIAYKARNRNSIGNEIVEINDISASVPVFNVSNLTTEKEKAATLRKKRYKGKIIDIEFESGFNIKLTPEHKIINGNTLEWMRADNFSVRDFVVSPLKLPHNSNRIYLLDILPGNWKVCLNKKEKEELKNIILKKYKSLAEFNRKFILNRHILSGASQFSIEQFKKVISELGIYNKWKEKTLSYARKFKPDYIDIPYLTPELGYLLGFIYGKGYVKINKRRAIIQVVQSTKHKKYISKFTKCWKEVFGKEPNIYTRTIHSNIRGKDIRSENVILYSGSVLLGEIYEKFVGNSLKNILLLPDEVLKSFIAGAMDADGCISIKNSIKNSKKYKTVDVEFSLSNNKRANLNFMLALRRIDCYSKLVIIPNKNVQNISITGRNDIMQLKESIKKYSIKAQKEIPNTINNVSSTSDKLPSGMVSEIAHDISKINKTTLINKGIWNTLYAYKEKKYQPSRGQLKKIINRLSNELNPEVITKIEPLLCRDFFLDKIKSIKEYDFDGFVYDLYVPRVNNFVAEGIFVHNCVDEFDKMEKEDRAAMHEALEQQSYHPDTEIMFSNGEKIKIGKFVDELMNSKKDIITKGKDCEILIIPKEMRFMMLTTDFKSIYSVPIDRVSRHKAPNYFIRITYTNGRSILVTPEHPVYVFKDGEIKETPAESVKKGMLSPAPSKYFIKNKKISLLKVEVSKRSKQVVLPDKINKDLCRLLGYIVTEGHIYYSIKNRDAEIIISNTDKEIVDDCCDIFKNIFGVSPHLQKQEPYSRKKATMTLYTARCISIPIYKFFMSNFSEIAKKADKKRVPGCIFHTSKENKVQFLLGAFRGDGFYDSERMGYVTTSADLARDYTDLLLSLGIYSYITHCSTYFSNKEKRMKSAYKVVISGSESIEYFYELVGKYDKRKDKIDYLVQRSKNKLNDYDRIPVEVVSRLKKLLKEYRLDDGYFCKSIKTNGTVHRKIVLKYIEKLESYILSLSNVSDMYDPRKIRKKYRIPIAEIASKIKKSASMVAYIERNPSTKNYTFLFETVKQMAQEKIKNTKISISALKDFVASDIRFVEVKNVEILQNDNIKWVYDVTVEPNHTFISECLVLHNTISIAKAGIVAKFRAETCVLAAANPKFGRFSSEKAITDQFDIPPALLSRFDLIFPLRDIMDNIQDQGVANYVLKAYSGKKEEQLSPPIDVDFIRKYIAYARKNLNPVVGEDAQKQIEEYYLRLRKESGKDVVQITARQLEGIIRLSCASAKMRLKNVVEKEDVDRAIRLIEYSLNLVARDKETGKIDVDRVTQGPREKRDKVKGLSEILEYLTENGKKHCLIEDFVKQAKEQGIDEKDAKIFIENAKREGKIFEPRDGEIGMIE